MPIDRLTPLDRLMLWASRRWPQDVGAVAILDGSRLHDEAGQFNIDVVRSAIDRRLHLVPRFRQVIFTPRRGLGGPLWVDAPSFDLTQHVRELPLEPPAGEEALLTAVEQIVHTRLDPTRPRWEMWFMPGLPDHRIGVFVRIHHTIADGMAALSTVATFLDSTPDARSTTDAPFWKPADPPSEFALFNDNVSGHFHRLARSLAALAHPRDAARRWRAAWPAIRELIAERPATATSLDRMVGPGRRIGLIGTSLDETRKIGHAHDATVNDVLLTVVAGALRSLLAHRGEPVDDITLRIYVPVSLRRKLGGLQQGNLIAQMAVPLRLGEADPRRRLRQIAADTTLRKARVRTNLGSLLVGGSIGRRLMLLAVTRQRVNLTSATIPGPWVPLYLAGMPVLDVFPVLPLVYTEPLAVGAISYAGTLTIGISADRDAFADFDVLVAAMRDELAALGAPVRPGLLPSKPVRTAARRPARRPAAPSRFRPAPNGGSAPAVSPGRTSGG